MNISGYIRSGKGHGLRLVSLIALLLAVVYSVLLYFQGVKSLQDSQLQEFLRSIPVFTLKDGVIQDQNIRWHVSVPLNQMAGAVSNQGAQSLAIVIDTRQKELQLPVADGAYLTSEYMYFVAEHGTSVNRVRLAGTATVNVDFLNKCLKLYIGLLAVLMGLISLVASFLGFLLIVGFSAIFGAALRVSLGKGRVWRSSAVAWGLGLIIGLLVKFILSGIMGGLLTLCICVILSVGLLKRAKD